MDKRRKKFRLRLDLLKYGNEQDILDEALANLSRYRAEPSFAKTGVGYLRSATPEEREAEMKRSDKFIKRLEVRAALAKRAKKQAGGSSASIDCGYDGGEAPHCF